MTAGGFVAGRGGGAVNDVDGIGDVQWGICMWNFFFGCLYFAGICVNTLLFTLQAAVSRYEM